MPRHRQTLAMTGLMLACSLHAFADPLPEPLTLNDALSLAGELHPELERQRALREQADARRREAASRDDISIAATAEGRWIDPSPNATFTDRNDSRAQIRLDKTLYDFGRTKHAVAAADREIAAQDKNLSLQAIRQKRDIMARYFDVILADLSYAHENEAMATAYVSFDKAQDRHELGEISDIDLMASESEYQQQLLKRQRASDEQRHARERLAFAINRPGELSSDLVPPELPGNRKPIPELNELLPKASENNLQLAALREKIDALSSQKKSARAESRPRLYVHLEATEYEIDTPSREQSIAALGLEVPLYRGDRTRAAMAVAEAESATLKAELRAAEFQLRGDLLETLQTLRTLTLQLEQADKLSAYRDLYLDRSRARYDLEINTDLGDAMVEQSAARLFKAQTDFQLALARERLVELTGDNRFSALTPSETPPPAEENKP